MSELNPPPPLEGGGGFLISPATPPKDPVVIMVLNLILGGAGSIVIGQKTKGIVIIAACLAGIPLTWGVISFAIAFAAAMDGYLQARHLADGHPIGKWTWFGQHR